MRFKTIEEFQAWNTERQVRMKPSQPNTRGLPEEVADEGPESNLQTKILNWAKEHGFPCFHDQSKKKNKAGWPDITLCLPDRIVLFIELKSATGIMRDEQKHIRQQMVFLGHNHYIVKSYKRFLEIALKEEYGR